MATECAINKIDSNVTGLAFAEEVCLKQLPTVADDGALPNWYGLEPNSYSDFGGELTTVARSPIDPSRQNKKGTVTDLDASGGFNTDFTKTNLVRLMQGFFFADWREKAATAPVNGAAIPLTGVTAVDKTYAAATGLIGFNTAGLLVLATGSGFPTNNGVKTVTAATAGTVVVAEALVDEPAPPAAMNLKAIGMQFAAADIAMTVTSGIPALTAIAGDFTTLGLIVGEWIFIGGDLLANRFANNVGYARIGAIEAKKLTFDETRFAPVAEAGAGKTIRIFFGLVLKNEKTPSLIKRRSYNIERTLGQGETATQAEYLEGAVANEFTLNIPQAEKLNADLTFVACDNTYRSGEAGDEIKDGPRIAAPGEDAYNTSSDIASIKMSVIDPATSNPSALFGYVSEGSISINNGVTPNKAVGVLGAFDTSAANFVVGGSITAYFTTVAAVKAVRANADVGLSIIIAAKNAGTIFDIPLLGLGGGRLAVEKDAPITVPLTPAGAENKNGYTLLYGFFPYLPAIAMPK
jgi:hypothetical protein